MGAGAPPGSTFRPFFVLPSAHIWRIQFRPSSSLVGPFFSRAVIATQPPMETADSSSNYDFPRQHLCLPFQGHRHQSSIDTRASSSPELCDQSLKFFRAPSSTELRRHLRFATRARPAWIFVVICRHLSFATRAPPWPELHVLPELHLRLPQLLYSMSFPFKPLTMTRQPFFIHYHRPRHRRYNRL